MIQKLHEKIKRNVKQSNERGARRQLLEELFYDLYRSRHQIYWMNFVRGLSFGFGTILGGTVLVAFIIWILTQVAGWFPGIGEYINQVITAMQKTK